MSQNTEGDTPISTMNNNNNNNEEVKQDLSKKSGEAVVAKAEEETSLQNGRSIEEIESDAQQLIQQHADIVAAAKAKENEQRLAFKKLEDIKKKLELLKLGYATGGVGGAGGTSQPKTEEEAIGKKYNFWETQPVQKLNEVAQTNEAIEPDKPKEELRQEPLKLPDGFVWVCLDIDSDSDLKELYTLLFENYVEDDDNMFRFNYLPEFLRWVLKPPGWNADWFIGVRVAKTPQQQASGKLGKLVGFISAIPATIRIYDKIIKTVEINFLCVHKKLRSKRMTPVLISEITRRVNHCGLFQAVYTAGVFLPKPISTCRYYHRSLNPRKLIDVGFSILSRNMTMSRTIKFYRLPEQPKLTNLRQFEQKDIGQVHRLLQKHMEQFDLVPCFEENELLHWLTPIPNVVETYVAEAQIGDDKKKQIVGFFSFYILPSTVMNHKTYKDVKAAYSFYNVPSEHAPLVDLMHDALVIAKNSGLDVFNALNQMQNSEYLDKLKFGSGDGNLHYYLFNWKCPSLKPDKVGIVLQ